LEWITEILNETWKFIILFLNDNIPLIVGSVKAVVIAVAIMSVVPILVWLERRLMGRFQVRLGPNRVGPFGLGQPLADTVKLLFKESIIQSSADKFLFHLAPAIVVFTAIVGFAVIPFGAPFEVFGQSIEMWGANVNSGILFVFAISGMGIYGMVLAGLASNNKYSLMGGLRSSAQMISYELTLGLSALSIIVLTGSLNLVDMVKAQETIPFILVQPLAFLLFYIAGVAETNRAPFDLPEAEQELVAGFHTEYTGMKFAMFFMGEYINMVTMSALVTLLFLGGWNAYGLPVWPIVAFALKVGFLLCVFIWLRSTFPRIRYDRLMTFGWKVLLPLCILNLLITSTLKVI
jgi:NADH-quinone oxidoreductase subunit H